MCVGGLFLFLFIFAMSEVRLANSNVNGARDVRKRAMLNEVIKQKNLDVILLPETHSDGKMFLTGRGSLRVYLY